jgi:type I restriction enzyme S subunit
LRQSEALRQSILKQAFEGKLVEQDPNDPPASELLEQIKAEKKANQSGTSKRRRKATSADR